MENNKSIEDVYFVAELAELASVSETHIRNLCAEWETEGWARRNRSGRGWIICKEMGDRWLRGRGVVQLA